MGTEREAASILLVDDRVENLLALEAILDPVDCRTVRATSGQEALRRLLSEEIAVILLDVQMPTMDGFETAALIKQRERTRHIPIIFLTAISKDMSHVFQGYSVGAVDYMFKPFEPTILRSKVTAFLELHHKTREVERQATLLRKADERERARELEETRRHGEERSRNLAEAMPQMVWTANEEGHPTYLNERWFEFTGQDPAAPLGDRTFTDPVHPEDLERMQAQWLAARMQPGANETWEIECRFRRRDGVYRWHIGRARLVPGVGGTPSIWVGTATDIDDARRSEEVQRVLAEAGRVLGSSLDVHTVMPQVAQLAVPGIADWCSIDVLDECGQFERLGAASAADLPPDQLARLRVGLTIGDAKSAPAVAVATGEVLMLPDRRMDEQRSTPEAIEVARLESAGATAIISFPLVARTRVIGVVTLALANGEREFGTSEVSLAQGLAARAASAVDVARLYRTAEARAQAAQVLDAVGDGVFLVDSTDTVRLWNPAAAAITGLPSEAVIGRTIGSVIPSWGQARENVPVLDEPGVSTASARAVPVDIAGRDLWLSMSGVGFDGGIVYAFRDLTEEHAVERMKSDFVATVSHELRTPLAAIYGAAATLQRTDIDLGPAMRDELLTIVSDQAQRLADIVNDVLLASRVDAGHMNPTLRPCDAVEIADEVVAAARARDLAQHELVYDPPSDVPAIAADPGHLKQVIANLIDNAIKYSPTGGAVEVAIEPGQGAVRFAVRDEGIGIPAREQRRIFEKFYRVDADMTSGIGGTGLGLYICRELVRHMQGRIWIESSQGLGTTFFVELPVAVGAEAVRSGSGARDTITP